ncbi:unnamed protein product [Clonostachys byssicola]|uniref:Uncharacterized protein n=1 Tax=Clonostachys byssicola TaxID=160290 RepID=A0A9N9UMW4_9HYPO|nr:unnamed protein product [Clonostachys byssicola]
MAVAPAVQANDYLSNKQTLVASLQHRSSFLAATPRKFSSSRFQNFSSYAILPYIFFFQFTGSFHSPAGGGGRKHKSAHRIS